MGVRAPVRGRRGVSQLVVALVLLAVMVFALIVVSPFVADQLFRAEVEAELNYVTGRMLDLQGLVGSVAWAPGRTRSISITPRYGELGAAEGVVTFSIYATSGGGESLVANVTTGMVFYRTPFLTVEGEYQAINPLNPSFVYTSGISPYTSLYKIGYGHCTYLVLVPSVLVLNASLGSGSGTAPILHILLLRLIPVRRIGPVTVSCANYSSSFVEADSIRIAVSYPSEYPPAFFPFGGGDFTLDVPPGSTLMLSVCDISCEVSAVG